MMRSTRHSASGQAVEPSTPAQDANTPAATSKMSKKLLRDLHIDANPSLGGEGSSLKRKRRGNETPTSAEQKRAKSLASLDADDTFAAAHTSPTKHTPAKSMSAMAPSSARAKKEEKTRKEEEKTKKTKKTTPADDVASREVKLTATRKDVSSSNAEGPVPIPKRTIFDYFTRQPKAEVDRLTPPTKGDVIDEDDWVNYRSKSSRRKSSKSLSHEMGSSSSSSRPHSQIGNETAQPPQPQHLPMAAPPNKHSASSDRPSADITLQRTTSSGSEPPLKDSVSPAKHSLSKLPPPRPSSKAALSTTPSKTKASLLHDNLTSSKPSAHASPNPSTFTSRSGALRPSSSEAALAASSRASTSDADIATSTPGHSSIDDPPARSTRLALRRMSSFASDLDSALFDEQSGPEHVPAGPGRPPRPRLSASSSAIDSSTPTSPAVNPESVRRPRAKYSRLSSLDASSQTTTSSSHVKPERAQNNAEPQRPPFLIPGEPLAANTAISATTMIKNWKRYHFERFEDAREYVDSVVPDRVDIKRVVIGANDVAMLEPARSVHSARGAAPKNSTTGHSRDHLKAETATEIPDSSISSRRKSSTSSAVPSKHTTTQRESSDATTTTPTATSLTPTAATATSAVKRKKQRGLVSADTLIKNWKRYHLKSAARARKLADRAMIESMHKASSSGKPPPHDVLLPVTPDMYITDDKGVPLVDDELSNEDEPDEDEDMDDQEAPDDEAEAGDDEDAEDLEDAEDAENIVEAVEYEPLEHDQLEDEPAESHLTAPSSSSANNNRERKNTRKRGHVSAETLVKNWKRYHLKGQAEAKEIAKQIPKNEEITLQDLQLRVANYRSAIRHADINMRDHDDELTDKSPDINSTTSVPSSSSSSNRTFTGPKMDDQNHGHDKSQDNPKHGLSSTRDDQSDEASMSVPTKLTPAKKGAKAETGRRTEERRHRELKNLRIDANAPLLGSSDNSRTRRGRGFAAPSDTSLVTDLAGTEASPAKKRAVSPRTALMPPPPHKGKGKSKTVAATGDPEQTSLPSEAFLPAEEGVSGAIIHHGETGELVVVNPAYIDDLLDYMGDLAEGHSDEEAVDDAEVGEAVAEREARRKADLEVLEGWPEVVGGEEEER